MTEQQVNSRRHVLIASLLVVVTAAAFGVSFYFLDGMALVAEYADEFRAILERAPSSDDDAASSEESTVSKPAGDRGSGEATVSAGGLILPEGMPEEFALRVWQEQIDSQDNIERLANGDVESVGIRNVTERGERAILDVRVGFKDGSSADGTLEMVRFDGVWYFARVTGLRPGASRAETPLPRADEVDPGVMNTLLEQHAASAATLEEYATGVIELVTVEDVVQGPGTVRLTVEMEQSHPHTGYGDLVLISKELGGRTTWFLARFTKTADVPS